MACIECKNLILGYEKVVVSDLSFVVNEGDYLCIVGENGSGKSTLMKTLLGLVPPLGGQIVFGDGLERNEIGYLPQQTVVQKDFPASVWEIVLSGFQSRVGMRPFFTKAMKAEAELKMQRLGIASLKKKSYRNLSGGQQQRVLLCRALCAAGKLLLLDEPVASLDPKAAAELYELIKSLNDEGITVIMISHDMEGSLRYATHILNLGQNVFFGTREDYLRNAKTETFAAGEGSLK